MNDQFWNERYKQAAFAYGKSPNVFFKNELEKLPLGRLLVPADGEGRNGVYAARLGWQVTSFDLSTAGQSKALALAKEANVSLQYEVGDFADLSFEPVSFDAIALIYAHFSAHQKAPFHQRLGQLLRPGGYLILEAFSKSHLSYRQSNPKVGGPPDIEMLYSVEEITRDFPDFELIQLAEQVVDLQEGAYHNGQGAVIRFVGRKK